MSELTCIETYCSREEAELARSFLEANGIDAVVFTDDCGGTRPHLQLSEGVRLMVKQEDKEKAFKLFEDTKGMHLDE